MFEESAWGRTACYHVVNRLVSDARLLVDHEEKRLGAFYGIEVITCCMTMSIGLNALRVLRVRALG